MTTQTVVQLLSDMLPKSLPTVELSSFEQGVLAGQQMMLDKLKQHIEAQEPSKHTKDR